MSQVGGMADPFYPMVDDSDVGWISREDMVEVDRIMIDQLHIELLQMMENAGRNLARLVLDMSSPATVTVYAGSGADAWRPRG